MSRFEERAGTRPPTAMPGNGRCLVLRGSVWRMDREAPRPMTRAELKEGDLSRLRIVAR
jgi:hypothetical protein